MPVIIRGAQQINAPAIIYVVLLILSFSIETFECWIILLWSCGGFDFHI